VSPRLLTPPGPTRSHGVHDASGGPGRRGARREKACSFDELHQAAGNYLAGKLRCGGALVTSGAAAALTLGTAACMTLGNKDAIASIPTDVTGLKNEVIVQKSHRYEYDTR